MRGNTLYFQRDSQPHRWHPLTKLALALLFLVAAATLPGLLWLLAAFVFLQLSLAAWGKVLRRFARSCFTVITPFVISLLVIQGFFAEGTTALLVLGPFTFTAEGALAGLTAAARILLALGGVLLLMLTTRPDALMLGLTQRGLPQSLAYIVLSALQIFPRFQERAQVILEAQQSRGLETQVSLLGRARLLVPLAGPLVLSSVVDVEERAMALEARAFSRTGQKTSFLLLHDNSAQRMARWVCLGLCAALIIWRIWMLVA